MFFFKQKTAYEVRISDWSSDVCSSDLVLAIVAIVGLIFSINRAQRQRYETTMELNNRNQEAIMRLLDEMGSLAEGDLTVKATVTEDMTGAIADSINFAVEQLRSLVQTINDTSV